MPLVYIYICRIKGGGILDAAGPPSPTSSGGTVAAADAGSCLFELIWAPVFLSR